MNHWVFVFNAHKNLEDAPLKSYYEFQKIRNSLTDLVICTTPNIEFETFTAAMPGFITYMIRFQCDSQVRPYESWESVLLPWILLQETSSSERFTELRRHQIGEESLLVFRAWLSENSKWLWEPYD